jgi:hypothetical protein
MSFPPSSLSPPPPVCALVSCDVGDFERWQRRYQELGPTRRSAGIMSAHIDRDAENANLVTLCLGSRDRATLDRVIGSDELYATTLPGVVAAPQITLVHPTEDRTRKDEPRPAVFVTHEVRDYQQWKDFFDEMVPMREAAGVLGYAIGREVARPNVVIVYIQAASHAKLRTMTKANDLRHAMQAAGVLGVPVMRFVDGGPWDK